jgi:hypothetical protein
VNLGRDSHGLQTREETLARELQFMTVALVFLFLGAVVVGVF